MGVEQPVREGDRLELQCEAVGEKGDGIFKKEGFVIIVPEAKHGKTYLIDIKAVKRTVAFGEVVNEIV